MSQGALSRYERDIAVGSYISGKRGIVPNINVLSLLDKYNKKLKNINAVLEKKYTNINVL